MPCVLPSAATNAATPFGGNWWNCSPGSAAPCHDDLTAEMSRRHNDLNVLCLSADMLGERLIDRMVEIWLNTPFEGGRHARRIAKITALEQQVQAEAARRG